MPLQYFDPTILACVSAPLGFSSNFKMVVLEGLEPPAFEVETRHSIRLSYSTIFRLHGLALLLWKTEALSRKTLGANHKT